MEDRIYAGSERPAQLQSSIAGSYAGRPAHGGNGLASATTAPRGSIGGELGEQEDRLRALYELVGILEATLGPVLAPAPPEGADTAKAPSPTGVMQVLRRNNQMLVFLVDRVQRITARLEL